jgi:hypothetical protein
MAKKIKIFSMDKCAKEESPEWSRGFGLYTHLKHGKKLNVVPSDSGLFHTVPPECPRVRFKKATNEKIVKSNHKQDASIVFGTDRPADVRSGYGRDAMRANSIDLVVGRMASAFGGKGPKDGSLVDNSFFADAARIHISQLTDIDKNFGLASKLLGPSIGRSGIGIKADAVRIIGREGVKIVTGKADGVTGFGGKGETNSLGGKLLPAPGIELIAGNNTGNEELSTGELIPYLQPVIKGKNLRDCLMDLVDLIRQIISSLQNHVRLGQIMNGVAGCPIAGVRATVSAIVQALTPFWVGQALNNSRTNIVFWSINYLHPSGKKYICSRNVRAT